MGRRIVKSRRHKKLKFVDPCYTGPPVRPRNKRTLPNEPPIEEDNQEVPNSVVELIESKNSKFHNKFKKRKKKKKLAADDFIVVKTGKPEPKQPGMTKPIKHLPETVAQGKNESQRQFLNRIQKMTDMAITEARLEVKYDVNIVNIDKSGTAQFTSTSDENQSGSRKAEKRKRQREKKKEKKKKKLEDNNLDNFQLKKDKIAFGDVVKEPPSFSLKNPSDIKAGKRNLMLKDIIKDKEDGNYKKQKVEISQKKKMELEAERNRIINLYRGMKKKNKAL